MIKIKKGTKTLEVTEKAFHVVYEDLGYKKVTSKANDKKDGEADDN